MLSRTHLTLIAAIGMTFVGCDGKDPERLGRVGKKIAEKSRRFADDANLPQVTITRPKDRKPAPVMDLISGKRKGPGNGEPQKDKPGNGERRTENRE